MNIIKNKKIIFLILILNINTFLTGENHFFGQFGQDKYLVENIFHHKRNGIFFDIGAYDGITCSNTYYFEKFLGWTGICVEPQLDKYKALRKKRNCKCLNGCIYNETAEKDFLKISGPIEGYSGILESYSQQHIETINSLINQYGGNKEIIKIKTYNFNDVCEKNNIKHIDLLSIDTEGSEEKIIKSINFNKIAIDIIIVENNYENKNIHTYLESNGFEYLCRLGVDEIYKSIKVKRILDNNEKENKVEEKNNE